jgi:hypothetical protein
MNPTPRTLEQMVNRPTAYEIGLFVDGSQVATVAFTERKTKRVVYQMIAHHRDEIVKFVSAEQENMGYHEIPGGLISDDRCVEIRFTGRTERELAS